MLNVDTVSLSCLITPRYTSHEAEERSGPVYTRVDSTQTSSSVLMRIRVSFSETCLQFDSSHKVLAQRNLFLGLPWWLSGKEPTCQCRRRRFDPWSGKIPHAVEQLSPWATTMKLVLQSLRVTTSEAHVP